VFSAPLPASVFSSISVLRRRQRVSRPSAANARLNVTASAPTRSINTASGRARLTSPSTPRQACQPSGTNAWWQIWPSHMRA
jgi:hypothetical protein